MSDVPDIADQEYEDLLNRTSGDLTGYDCKDCLNRGYFWHVSGYDRWTTPCHCMQIRNTLAKIKLSGLEDVINEFTLESFKPRFDWQKPMLKAAKRYIDADQEWFFLGGQNGSGKTWLCTGISRELIYKGKKLRYMQWAKDEKDIKFAPFSERKKLLQQWQECEVLYIDDFLKVANGELMEKHYGGSTQPNLPDAKDVELAFEIINTRYMKHLKTIISTEFYISEISKMDEALGSRIYERAKGFIVPVKKEEGRNLRLINDV